MRRLYLNLAGVLAVGCGAVVLWQPEKRLTDLFAVRWASTARHKPGQTDGPCLVAEKTVHDFGTVPSGHGLRAVFRIRNTGTRRLILHEDFCACTHSVRLPRIIRPGGAGNVAVNVPSSDVHGTVRRAITITTSDPRQPKLTFRVIANVSDEWQPP